MEVSRVDVTPVKDKGPFKGYGSFTLDHAVQIRFSLMSGKAGLFISLPGRQYTKSGNTNWQKEVLILDKELYFDIQTKVIEEYRKKLDQE